MFGVYFGNYLLKKELISQSKLDETASQPYTDFVRSFADTKGINIEDVEKLILDYQSEMDLSDEVLAAIKSDDINRVIEAMAFHGDDDDGMYNSFIKSLLRSIYLYVKSEKLMIKPVRILKKYTFENLAYLEIEAPLGLSVALAGDGNNLLAIANAFLDFGFTEMNEESFDAVCEFLNSICGMYVSDLSNETGIEADLTVPQYYIAQTLKVKPRYFMNQTMRSIGSIYLVPLLIDGKKIDLLVTEYTVNEFI